MPNSRLLIIFSAILFGFSAAPTYVGSRNVVEISFEDVSRLAVENNFDIQMVVFDARIARQKKNSSRSIYDTILSAEARYRDDQAARLNTFAGSRARTNDYNLSLSQQTPTGTNLTLESTNSRHWSDSVFSTINPGHDSALKITARQSLGRDFFGLQTRGSVQLALAELASEEFSAYQKIEDALLSAQKAYLELVLYEERERVAEEMFKRARELLDSQNQKFQTGFIERPALIAAQANVEARENDLRLARLERENRGYLLLIQLNYSDDPIELRAREAIAPPVDMIAPLSDLLREAMTQRFDYQRSLSDARARDIALSLKKNAAWPEIDLTASYAQNGISTEDFNASINELTDNHDPDFFLGLRVSVPLQNRKARSELTTAKLESARALLDIKRLERKISVEVFDQARAVETHRELARGAQRVSELQAQKLEAEMRRFQSGRSSTDTIIRFQEDVLDARWAEAMARSRYVAAVLDLRRVTGQALTEYWYQDFEVKE